MDYEPFAGIIQRALQARGTAEGDLARDPRYLAPGYVVRMCAALARAAAECSGRDVALDEVIRLERTCTVPTTTTSWHCAAPSSPVERRLWSTIPRRRELRVRRSAPRY